MSERIRFALVQYMYSTRCSQLARKCMIRDRSYWSKLNVVIVALWTGYTTLWYLFSSERIATWQSPHFVGSARDGILDRQEIRQAHRWMITVKISSTRGYVLSKSIYADEQLEASIALQSLCMKDGRFDRIHSRRFRFTSVQTFQPSASLAVTLSTFLIQHARWSLLLRSSGSITGR